MVRLGRYLLKFQVIHDYSQEHDNATITKLCDLLKVSRSGYYKWLHHEETESEKINQGLLTIIQELHAKYQVILGYRRMTLFVNRTLGTNYNKKRIRRLMLILGILLLSVVLVDTVPRLVLSILKRISLIAISQQTLQIRNGVLM